MLSQALNDNKNYWVGTMISIFLNTHTHNVYSILTVLCMQRIQESNYDGKKWFVKEKHIKFHSRHKRALKYNIATSLYSLPLADQFVHFKYDAD